ncbi:MAG TPA: hypothetical protein PLO37_11890 [Candidatus Hydrogenedentes bacterium]|nr:hypothetical protein [Candidatus Hydrogenedentota bacterium]HPG67543.1 hypothetical protein [Candidatus Hydrogenedentota bacterium]
MEKDFSLALGVPLVAAGSLLASVLAVVLSPVLFIWAWTRPESMDDLIAYFEELF